MAIPLVLPQAAVVLALAVAALEPLAAAHSALEVLLRVGLG